MTARIIGIGAYAPEQVVTNQDLTKFLDTNDAWIRERTGIGARTYLDERGNLGVGDRGGEARDRGRGHFSGGD